MMDSVHSVATRPGEEIDVMEAAGDPGGDPGEAKVKHSEEEGGV